MSHRALLIPKWDPKNCSLKEHKQKIEEAQNKISGLLKQNINRGQESFNREFGKTEFKNLNKKSKIFQNIVSIPYNYPGYNGATSSLQCQIVLTNILKNKKYWLRPVDDWKPKGNSFETVIDSLIRHLFCKYDLPSFMYKIWYIDSSKITNNFLNLNLFILLARGESLYKIAKLNGDSFLLETSEFAEVLDLPYIPLFTKKQCHIFLKLHNKNISFEEAIVKTQVDSLPNIENSHRLTKAIFSNQYFKKTIEYKFSRIYMENFKFECIQWLSQQAMFDYNQIPPILDYLYYIGNSKRLEVPSEQYSFKGRTINSVMEAMRAWHEDTLKYKAATAEWKTSGIKNYNKEKINNDSFHTFKIEEILNLKELQNEGRVMKHCVASYANSLANGLKSVWSFTKNGKKILTIEVSNSSQPEIVQVKGKCNAKAEKEDLHYIRDWAKLEGLAVSKYI